MELNQLLQNLLAQSGIKLDASSNKLLTELTRVTDARQTQVLLQTLAKAINQPIGRTLSEPLSTLGNKPSPLPTLPVQLAVLPNRQPNQSPRIQISVPTTPQATPTTQAPATTFTLPITKSQQQALQTLLASGKPSAPTVLVVQPSASTPANLTSMSPASVVLQLAKLLPTPQTSSGSQPAPVPLEVAVSKLPKPVIQLVINQLNRGSNSPNNGATNLPTTTVTGLNTQRADTAQNIRQPATLSPTPLSQTRPLAIKQAQQITPKQLQQALQQLAPLPPRSEAPQVSQPTLNTVRQPEQAIARVLQAVSQQLPQAESMQRPEALRQWVNDWFAAKPVSQSGHQQLGNLGKMLMMLLGFSLQQPKASGQNPGLSSHQQNNLSQLTQALLDQVLRPAPRLPGEPALTGEVRERINQLLQQMPQTQLQRLMQLFTSAVSQAQTSQARLADSPANQPEYFILLPTSNQQPAQNELLIRREHERRSNEDEGRTVWLFTLRFELAKYGPLLVKGRYHPAGTRVDFYTESESAERAMQGELRRLEERFEALEVHGLNLTLQQGKVPDTLAQQQSGIIRVTV